MIQSARQLKDKIRNLSKKTSADAQILLRNYMMERFLERIANSTHNQKFILKGGILVTSMVGIQARSTMDIDATVTGATIRTGEARQIIEDIASVDLSDAVHFVVNSVSDIMDETEYPGIRVTMTALMDRVKVPLKIDISTGDIITPHAIEYSFKLMFEDRTIRLFAYNLETVLAEKLETILTRTTVNTRMRDFYDIHILLGLYRKKIDSVILTSALSATSQRRGSYERMHNAETVLIELYNSKDMETLWNSYRSKFSYAANISWNQVLQSVRERAIFANLKVKKQQDK